MTEYLETTTEEWRPVLGWESCYEASSLGRIRNSRTGFIRKPVLVNHYHQVKLVNGGRSKAFSLHVLVAEAFHGARPPGYHVNHINFIRTDNRPQNLNYLTPRQNTQYSVDAGRSPFFAEQRPDKQIFAEADIPEIRRLATKLGDRPTSRLLGISKETVREIRLKKRYGWVV